MDVSKCSNTNNSNDITQWVPGKSANAIYDLRSILQSDLVILYDITLIPSCGLNDEYSNTLFLLFGDPLEGIVIWSKFG